LLFQGKFGLVEMLSWGFEWGSRFGVGGVVFYGFGSFDDSVLLFFYFHFLFADFFRSILLTISQPFMKKSK